MNNNKYLNLIELLKQALLFYANDDNYVPRTDGTILKTFIEVDHGYQARFVLNLIDNLKRSNDETEMLYNNIDNTEKNHFNINEDQIKFEYLDDSESMKKLIEEINKLKNNDSNI